MILAIRTDKPEAEIYLIDETGEIIAEQKWEAHRQLGVTIHTKIGELLKAQEAELTDIAGIVFYEGPGSFTGLRISASVSNALANSLSVSVVGVTSEAWLSEGAIKFGDNPTSTSVLPVYGSDPHITVQKR